MRVKLLTSFLSVLFLWGSLAVYGQQRYAASSREIKAATDNVHMAIAPSVASTEEAADFSKVILVDFSAAKEYAWNRRFSSFYLVFIHKPFKAYILFRALRN